MIKIEYLVVFSALLGSAFITLVLFFINWVLVPHKGDSEKLSAYECGFNPYSDARGNFDVRFYLVAILFIIFDLEITFLFPWAAAFSHVTLFGFWSIFVFLVILTIGFVYEWKKGALEWE